VQDDENIVYFGILPVQLLAPFDFFKLAGVKHNLEGLPAHVPEPGVVKSQLL
jgi:hypothetical protein